jgi:TPR repeat protein
VEDSLTDGLLMTRAVSPLTGLCLLFCLLISSVSNAAFAAPCYAQAMGQDSSWNLLNQAQYATLDARLSAAQASYRAGTINDAQLNAAFMTLCDSDARLRANYDAWIGAMPSSYVARLARANYLRQQGWDARGDEYASKTSDDRFAAQRNFFAQANNDYQVSLQLDSKPILSYAGLVNVGSSCARQGCNSSRQALDDALKVDPKAFVVRRTYMVLLETRWHGSVDEMEQFAGQSRGYVTASQYQVLDAMAIEDRGWTTEQAGDELAAAHLYQRAAERVVDSSQAERTWYAQLNFETGWAYQHANDLPTAIVWYRRAAALNPLNHHALSNLAWSLQKTGQATEAASFYQKSAALGDSWAEDQYGKCLWFGLGISKDQPAAVPYFARSAQAGSDEASRDLYWATRQLHLPLQGSLAGATKPAPNTPPVDKPQAGPPTDLGPTDS